MIENLIENIFDKGKGILNDICLESLFGSFENISILTNKNKLNNNLLYNGKYIFIGDRVHYTPLKQGYLLNNINQNIKKYNGFGIEALYRENFEFEEYNKIFKYTDKEIFLIDGMDEKFDINQEIYNNYQEEFKLFFKNLYGIKLLNYRGNLLKLEQDGEMYYMFSYNSDINDFIKRRFEFNPIVIIDINIYNPLAFFKEILLYFYQKNKNVFKDIEIDIKIGNYLKSVGINLDMNFDIIENLKNDIVIKEKIFGLYNNDTMYKMFLLILNGIGTVGKIEVNYAYVFKYNKDTYKLNPVKVYIDNEGKLKFGDLLEKKDLLYQDYMYKHNKTNEPINFNYFNLINEHISNIENVEFYEYEAIRNFINKLSSNEAL